VILAFLFYLPTFLLFRRLPVWLRTWRVVYMDEP